MPTTKMGRAVDLTEQISNLVPHMAVSQGVQSQARRGVHAACRRAYLPRVGSPMRWDGHRFQQSTASTALVCRKRPSDPKRAVLLPSQQKGRVPDREICHGALASVTVWKYTNTGVIPLARDNDKKRPYNHERSSRSSGLRRRRASFGPVLLVRPARVLRVFKIRIGWQHAARTIPANRRAVDSMSLPCPRNITMSGSNLNTFRSS